MSETVARRRGFIAYLNDPCAVLGAGPLLEQKLAIDLAADAMNATLARWCVDSGRRFAGQRCGDAILRLLGEVAEGDTVVVSDFSVLGADAEAVAVIAGTFALFGVAVVAAADVLGAPASMVAPTQVLVPDMSDVAGQLDGWRPLAVAR